MQVEINNSGKCIPNEGGQQDFANDWTHEIVGIEGGWMSGKTWVGARKLLTLHIYNSFNLETRQPTYIPSAAISPTFSNCLDFQVPELIDAAKECGLAARWKSTGTVSEGRYSAPALIFPDLGTNRRHSAILIRSAEKPSTITGWQVGAGWGDEPARWKEDKNDPKNDAILQFLARVRHPKSNLIQKIFTYTNEGDLTEIYQLFHRKESNYRLYRAPTKENPEASGFYESQKNLLTKDLQEQYLEGGTVSLRGGAVYQSFNRRKHVDDKLKLVSGLPLHLSCDWNIEPGMHFEIGQLTNPNSENWSFTTVYEIHERRLSVLEGMRRFQLLYHKLIKSGLSFPEIHLFGDASGSAEWSGTGQSNVEIAVQKLIEMDVTFRVRIPKANPMIVDRLNAVNMALTDGRGDVHWKCHPSCARLIEDRESLKRDKFGGINKDDKKLSHASDADDYRVEYLKPVRVTRKPKRDLARHVVSIME